MRHHHDQVEVIRRQSRRRTHLMLTALTFGVWAFTGWPVAALWNRLHQRRVTTRHYR